MPLPSAAASDLLEGLGPLLFPQQGDVWNFHILSGLWQETHDADETTDWFQIGKGVHQGCILLPCLFIPGL